jgi:hypothetical protein
MQIGGHAPEAFIAERWNFLKHHHFSQHLLSDKAHLLQQQSELMQQQLLELQSHLRLIRGSRWWRLGGPLRWAMRQWRSFTGR